MRKVCRMNVHTVSNTSSASDDNKDKVHQSWGESIKDWRDTAQVVKSLAYTVSV